MAHKISGSCQNCGTCVSNCPSGAISAKNKKSVIDGAKCKDCGTCASNCPAKAVSKA